MDGLDALIEIAKATATAFAWTVTAIGTTLVLFARGAWVVINKSQEKALVAKDTAIEILRDQHTEQWLNVKRRQADEAAEYYRNIEAKEKEAKEELGSWVAILREKIKSVYPDAPIDDLSGDELVDTVTGLFEKLRQEKEHAQQRSQDAIGSASGSSNVMAIGATIIT